MGSIQVEMATLIRRGLVFLAGVASSLLLKSFLQKLEQIEKSISMLLKAIDTKKEERTEVYSKISEREDENGFIRKYVRVADPMETKLDGNKRSKNKLLFKIQINRGDEESSGRWKEDDGGKRSRDAVSKGDQVAVVAAQVAVSSKDVQDVDCVSRKLQMEGEDGWEASLTDHRQDGQDSGFDFSCPSTPSAYPSSTSQSTLPESDAFLSSDADSWLLSPSERSLTSANQLLPITPSARQSVEMCVDLGCHFAKYPNKFVKSRSLYDAWGFAARPNKKTTPPGGVAEPRRHRDSTSGDATSETERKIVEETNRERKRRGKNQWKEQKQTNQNKEQKRPKLKQNKDARQRLSGFRTFINAFSSKNQVGFESDFEGQDWTTSKTTSVHLHPVAVQKGKLGFRNARSEDH